jgi:RNA polymerase subunit RPABC4/transcription elongation factor Spt4
MAARAKKGCKTCGKAVRDHGHLCASLKAKDQTCDWCGSLIMDARHMCDTKLKKFTELSINSGHIG